MDDSCTRGRRTSFLRVAALLLLSCAALAGPALAAAPVTSVAALDVSRYAGNWYEIARLPVSFQKKCVGDVTAAYTLRDDDQLGVRNACRVADGDTTVADGLARPVAGHPGRLEVRFAPEWLAWVPFVWADYWVLAVDAEYQWALVGEPGRKYLWILSREPTLDRARFDDLKRRATAMGYDLSPLVVSGTLR